MLTWDWAYRAFSRLHRRELRNMGPIRKFAELVLETAISVHSETDVGAVKPSAVNNNDRITREQCITAATTCELENETSKPSKLEKNQNTCEESQKEETRLRRTFLPENTSVTVKSGDDSLYQSTVAGASDLMPAGETRATAGISCPGGDGVLGKHRRRNEGNECAGLRRTALSELAAQDSHRKYPAMVDEVRRFFVPFVVRLEVQ